MKVTVFCSSSESVSPFLIEESEMVGRSLAEWGYEVVYGGANVGCMGALARGVRAGGGQLYGVVPEMDFMLHIVAKELNHIERVKGLAERKSKMIEMADRFLVLPGGVGTLDELFSVMALRSLKEVKAPIVLYDFMGCWKGLLEMLEIMCAQNLMKGPLSDHFSVASEREQLEGALR